MSGLSSAGSMWSSGCSPRADLLDLVLDPQPGDQLVRVQQRLGVGARQRARVARRPQPLGGRGRRDARRHARPAGEVDDRDHPAVLEVQAAAPLAAVLDDEAAQEAGRRAVGQREAGEQPQQRRVLRGEPEDLGDRGAGVDAPDRPAVDEHRHEDQRLLLRRVAHPAARDAVPRVRRAHEAQVRRVDAVVVGRPAARRGAADDVRRRSCAAGGGSSSSSGPSTRRARCRGRSWGRPRGARGCRARASRTATPGSPRSVQRQLDEPARQRVEHDRVDRRDAGRRDPALVQRDDHRADAARRRRRARRGGARRRSGGGRRTSCASRPRRGRCRRSRRPPRRARRSPGSGARRGRASRAARRRRAGRGRRCRRARSSPR